jgi:hypothetical protein
MHKKWPKVVLKLLIPKINHQELKLIEHQDKVVKEVEEEVKEVDVAEVKEVKEVAVVEVENSVVVEEENVVDVVVSVVVEEENVVDVVVKADVAVLDQEPLSPLMMKEMKFPNILAEKDNPIKKIPMPPITVMKEDQEPAEAAEVKRKMVTEKVTGETSPRDNIKRRVLMVRLKSLKLPSKKSQLKLKKPQKKLSLKKSSSSSRCFFAVSVMNDWSSFLASNSFILALLIPSMNFLFFTLSLYRFLSCLTMI